MSSHRLTAGCHLLTVVAALFLYTPVHAQSTAPIEGQITDQHGVVTGTVTYRQRIALPRQAVVQVQLLDVSKADAPAIVIAEQTIEPKGKQVPIPFSLNYAHAQIKENYRYAVQAKILLGGTLRYFNKQAYLVITGGNPNRREIVVEPVSQSKTAGPSAQLENTYWKLIEVNAKAVSVSPKRREAHLLFKPNGNKLQGFGGRNRIIGGYERKGDSIRFKASSTMMACVDGMDTEQEFLKALEAATSFKLSGEELELDDNDGLLARFRAVWLK